MDGSVNGGRHIGRGNCQGRLMILDSALAASQRLTDNLIVDDDDDDDGDPTDRHTSHQMTVDNPALGARIQTGTPGALLVATTVTRFAVTPSSVPHVTTPKPFPMRACRSHSTWPGCIAHPLHRC